MLTTEQAFAYADGQYDLGGDPRNPMCVHFGGDGAWHLSHHHETWGDAEACRDRRRSECAARVLANGHSEI
jgi:hypothetical protein